MAQDLNSKVLVNFRLPLGLKTKMAEAARKRGISLTGFAKETFEFTTNIDPEVWRFVTDLSGRHGLAEGQVLQNIVLRYAAEQEALNEVYGVDTPRMVPEFSKTHTGQVLTGRDLVAKLRNQFVRVYSILKGLQDHGRQE